MKTARTVDLPNHGNTKVSSVRQEGAKGNGNDSHVYVNDRIVPRAFRIARIPILEAAMKSLSRHAFFARFFFFWPLAPCLCPCSDALMPNPPWGHQALDFRPRIGKLLKTSARLPLGLEWDLFVNVHDKTGLTQHTFPVFAVPADDVRWAQQSSALGILGGHARRVVASGGYFSRRTNPRGQQV